MVSLKTTYFVSPLVLIALWLFTDPISSVGFILVFFGFFGLIIYQTLCLGYGWLKQSEISLSARNRLVAVSLIIVISLALKTAGGFGLVDGLILVLTLVGWWIYSGYRFSRN